VLGSIGLVAAAAAVAGNGNREQLKFNTADQAAAHAAVIRRSDLGSTGWKGGARKPDLSPGPSCPNYDPKQSDLVLTGAARTEYSKAGLDFESQTGVLQTERMVRLDWERSALARGVLPCLSSVLKKSVGTGTKIVSARKIAFPHVATYSAAFRFVIDVRSSGAAVRVMIDLVAVGRGRTEITLTTTAPYAARAVVAPAEVRLAQLLVGRIRA
jgi:hypothetical protein